MNLFETLINSIATSRVGYRRKLLYFRRIIWAQKKSIKQKEKDILERFCGVKPERTVDPETGQVNLKYDPKDINGDYYF